MGNNSDISWIEKFKGQQKQAKKRCTCSASLRAACTPASWWRSTTSSMAALSLAAATSRLADSSSVSRAVMRDPSTPRELTLDMPLSAQVNDCSRHIATDQHGAQDPSTPGKLCTAVHVRALFEAVYHLCMMRDPCTGAHPQHPSLYTAVHARNALSIEAMCDPCVIRDPSTPRGAHP